MKLTKKQKILIFKKAVRKWSEYFGLHDWEVFIKPLKTESRAECHWDYNGRIATIFFGEKWISSDITEAEIDRVAFHEVAELFCYFLMDAIRDSRGSFHAQECTHRVIRFLENKILGVEPE